MSQRELYYYVVQRFPPKIQLTGKALDAYCEAVLRNDECRRRIMGDIYDTADGLAYEQRNQQE